MSIKTIDLSIEPLSLIRHDIILTKIIYSRRKIKINNLLMNNIIKYNEWLIKEALGVNKDVSDFCDVIYSIIETDLKNRKYNNSITIKNNCGINTINVIYKYVESDNVASVRLEDKDVYLSIWANNIVDLLSTLNHEFLHIYSQLKGYNRSDEYTTLMNLTDNYNSNDGWIGRLCYILYFFSNFEINSRIQEIWKEIKNGNIKDNKTFNDFLIKHACYKNIKAIETFNLKDIWCNIEKEGSDKILIREFNIKNIDKWLNKKEKMLKNNSERFKKRLFSLRDLMNSEY